MKHFRIGLSFLIFVLVGCTGWTVQPLPYLSPSPYPTSTPVIQSPTPLVLVPPLTATFPPTAAAASDTPSATEAVPMTFVPSITQTPLIAVNTKILGCDTSLDLVHGMGEVTNAYVTIGNLGNGPLNTLCATLNALDEGRVHPDKTRCVAVVPAGYQVTEKLTVDTTFKEASPIQVDVTSNSVLLQRVSQNSCTDISLMPPNPDDLGVVKPIP